MKFAHIIKGFSHGVCAATYYIFRNRLSYFVHGSKIQLNIKDQVAEVKKRSELARSASAEVGKQEHFVNKRVPVLCSPRIETGQLTYRIAFPRPIDESLHCLASRRWDYGGHSLGHGGPKLVTNQTTYSKHS